MADLPSDTRKQLGTPAAARLAVGQSPTAAPKPTAPKAPNGPLADTVKQKYLMTSYSYPETIGQNVSPGLLYPHVVKFTIFIPSTDASALSTSIPNVPDVSATNTAAATTTFAAIKNRKQIDSTISLYMPDTVSQSYDAQYDDISLKDKKLTGVSQMVASMFNDFFTDRKSIGFTDTILAAVSGNQYLPTEAIQQAKGSVLNPNVQLLFRAVALRQFQFEFMFSPRNSNESVQIQNIINTLKFHAAPEIVGSFDPDFLSSNFNIGAGLALSLIHI